MPDEIPTSSKRKSQSKIDEDRRHRHFQVRLDSQLAGYLQHYADKRHQGVINAALQTIILKFFNAK